MPSKESQDWANKLLDEEVLDRGRLADLLDEAIREARVGEAACWYTNWNVDDSIRSFGKWAEARLAQLREGKT